MMTLYLSGWPMAMYLSIDMMTKRQDSVLPSNKKMYIWVTELAKEIVFFCQLCQHLGPSYSGKSQIQHGKDANREERECVEVRVQAD